MKRTSEAAFDTAIKAVLLGEGYTRVDANGFDCERAIFPDEALAFIRATQAKVWDKLEALHGEQTGTRVLESLCKWLDVHGKFAMLRHGFESFEVFGKATRPSGPREESRAELITAAVTGRIPLEQMTE